MTFFKNLLNVEECLRNVGFCIPHIIQRWEAYFLIQDYVRKGSGSYGSDVKIKTNNNPLLGEEEEEDNINIDDAEEEEQLSSLSIHSSIAFKSNVARAHNHCAISKSKLKEVYSMICKGIIIILFDNS
jgi:hypothetical protein